MTGTIELIREPIERCDSLLLLGRPGIGTTTKLREIARVLADDLGKRMIVIEGDGAVALEPRPGELRKLQHRIAVRHRLTAESVGREAGRHLVLQPE